VQRSSFEIAELAADIPFPDNRILVRFLWFAKMTWPFS
jgi:hypothetical protein